jgi:hypothetical protein
MSELGEVREEQVPSKCVHGDSIQHSVLVKCSRRNTIPDQDTGYSSLLMDYGIEKSNGRHKIKEHVVPFLNIEVINSMRYLQQERPMHALRN